LPQILVDENVPMSVMEWLKKIGLNAIRASEAGLIGAKKREHRKIRCKER